MSSRSGQENFCGNEGRCQYPFGTFYSRRIVIYKCIRMHAACTYKNCSNNLCINIYAQISVHVSIGIISRLGKRDGGAPEHFLSTTFHYYDYFDFIHVDNLSVSHMLLCTI